MASLRQRLFDDKKIIAAGMRFNKRNHYLSIVPQCSITVTQITTSVESEPRDSIGRCERTAAR
jgi:hypothetical protein